MEISNLSYKCNYKWHTNVKITVFDLDGKVIDVQELHNLITTVGLSMARNFLKGTIADGQIKYMAMGSDSTVPALADTTLGTETFRKANTAQVTSGDDALITTTYVSPSENAVQIEEIGWFAGAAAGAGADSGIMISRVLYSRLKTTLESVQVVRTDTIQEA